MVEVTTTITPSYEDFEPFCKWQREEGHDTLELHLYGFKKGQVRVQLKNQTIVTIRGERPIDEGKLSRFCKEIRISKECKTNEIHAKLSGGILYLVMPKKQSLLPSSSREEEDGHLHPKDVAKISSRGNQLRAGENSLTMATKKDIVGAPLPTTSPPLQTILTNFSLMKLATPKNIAMVVLRVFGVFIAVIAFLMHKAVVSHSPVEN